METYVLISYVLSKYSNSDTSYLTLDLNLADVDKMMDHFKITIIGTAKNAPKIKDAANLDPLCKELLVKLTKAIGNELVFGIAASKNTACLNFSEKAEDNYFFFIM